MNLKFLLLIALNIAVFEPSLSTSKSQRRNNKYLSITSKLINQLTNDVFGFLIF